MQRPNLRITVVAILLTALLVADLFLNLRQHQFYRWLVLFIYITALAVSAFFESKWISKQADQLKARFHVANISMWIFLFLAIIATVPNIFITGDIDKTTFWPAAVANDVLLGTSFMRRRELLHELAEREKSITL